MTGSSLKKKLNRRALTIGSWITIGNEIIAELMAKMAFDWLTIDMEHSAIDLSEAQKLIRIIQLCGCVPLVRVPENDATVIKRVMDAGAHGVIVPMVNSKEDAQKAVEAVKYPSQGKRGVGLARAQGYGMGFGAYKDWVNKESVVIVQVEHVRAVKHLRSILGVKGVDGFIVGPYDLSASMGYPGEFLRPAVRTCLEEIIRVAKALRTTAGIHVIPPDHREVKARIEEGYRLIAFSLDTLFLANACQTSLTAISTRRKHA